MQRCLIFLTLLFSMSSWAMPSWNPYVMTHERFVHLDSEEQNKIIIKTMEMIVELDAQTQKSVVSTEKQESFEKYVFLLKKLQSFVMSEAYAQETDPSFLKLAKDFSVLLNKLGKDGCIYAGYVSRLVNGRCSSPSLLTSRGKNDEITRLIKSAYLTKTGQKDVKCGGPTKISCNPVVFGYKNSASKVPFCVATSSDESHNAAYKCMDKALSVTPEKGADSKDVRLDYLRNAIKDSKSAPAFDAAHKFIFRTCVCGDTELDPTYKKYMRPHRTCFGMLNALREVGAPSCADLSSDSFKASFAQEWTNYFGSSKFSSKDALKQVHYDVTYGELMAKQDMKKMCGIGPTIGGGNDDNDDDATDGTVCDAPCVYEEVDGKKVLSCTVTKVTVTKDGVSTVTTKFKPAKYTPKDGDEEMQVTSEDGKQTFTCPIVKPEDPKDLGGEKCTLTQAVSEDKKTVTITVAFPGKEPEFTWNGEGKESEDRKSFVAAYTKEKKTVSISIAGGAAAPATDKTQPTDAKPAAVGEAACTTDVGGDDADDGKKYTIDAQPEPHVTADVTIKVKAVVTVTGGDKKLPETYKIVWLRTDYKGPAAVEKKEEEEDDKFKVKDGDGTDPKDKKEDKKEPEKAKPTKEETPGADTSEIDEPRVKEEYKACAQLLDDKGEKVADSCAPIAPIDAAKPAFNGGVNRPPVFMTPSYNTRTMGIQ